MNGGKKIYYILTIVKSNHLKSSFNFKAFNRKLYQSFIFYEEKILI
jgi:hypothetical protein